MKCNPYVLSMDCRKTLSFPLFKNSLGCVWNNKK